MRNLLIAAAIIWALGSALVPMLESWELPGSIDTMGSNQIERIQE